MESDARGPSYSRARRAWEALLSRLYAGGWPAAGPWADCEVRRVELALAGLRLPPGLDELRLGFASDLHAGPTTSPRTLARAFELLRAFDPHLLLLGGDYVLFEADFAERIAPLVASIPAPLGRFAVLGNHDRWAGADRVGRALRGAGARVLVNECLEVAPSLSIGGLDDAWSGAPDYAAAFANPGDLHLLLMHSPDHLPRLRGRRWALALCGHTHGGHLALPGGVPLYAPSPLSRRYHSGAFALEQGPLVVSRGVGNVELPFRAFAPPDVVCARLLPAA